MKSHTIIGTAGHIDHGKTAVIKALTGIDADRLKEEKERGITIDIGFAYWKDAVTIIDVPGHEKFIRNMVAGVSTIDFFLLVIAADDGIMPQTIEHLDILNFFNISEGIIILNKIDLVDEEWLTLVREEIREMLISYGLNSCPVVEVSAIKGTNIDALRHTIDKKIDALEPLTDSKPFRLFVDRSFSIKGFGTVVTGTILSGQVQKGDELDIIPGKRRVRIRGLQSHTANMNQMGIGYRAAVNLQGVEKSEIRRGDMLVQTNAAFPVSSFTGIIKTVSNIPIRISNRSMVHVYVGTAERFGQLIWYEQSHYLAGSESYHVLIKLEEGVGAAAGDAFLIRSQSPVYTLAGGKITEIDPPRFRHRSEEWTEYFANADTLDMTKKMLYIIKNHAKRIISLEYLAQKVFQTKTVIADILKTMIKNGKIRIIEIKDQPSYIHEDNFRIMAEEILTFLAQYHDNNPLRNGINRQELINALHWKWLPIELTETLITFLLNQKKIKLKENLFALHDFKIQMSKDTDSVQKALLDLLAVARFSPPPPQEIATEIGLSRPETDSLIRSLNQEGKIKKISNLMILHHDVWQELLNFLRSYFQNEEQMPVSALKEFIQTTRKFAIPLFEYLDSEGFTRRNGDIRHKGIAL